MNKRRNYLLAVTALLALALALRVAACVVWERNLPPGVSFHFGDSDGYLHLAGTISQGLPYQYGSPDARIFRTPGYPILLAGWNQLAGEEASILWARMLSAVLGTLAVAAVLWLARLWFDARTSLLAGGIAAVYPGAIVMSVLVLAEAPFIPLMLLQIGLWTLSASSSHWKKQSIYSVSAGVAAGLAVLMRPSWLLFTPLVAVAAIMIRPRKQLLISLTILVALCLTLSPWWVRNYFVAGRFVPTTLQVGASLYDGLHEEATGASDMRFVPQFEKEQRQADAASSTPPAGIFEARLDDRMKQAAWNWASKNPGEALKLAGIKFIRMWNLWPNEGAFARPAARLAVLSSYLPVLLCGLWGGVRFRRLGLPVWLCILPAVYFSLLHCVFVGSLRYRIPAMFPLMVLAAATICFPARKITAAAGEVAG